MLPVFPGQALFRRELTQTLRNDRFYWLMALALLGFAAGVITLWPDAERQYSPQIMTSFSNQVVRALSALISFMVCLLVPAIAGSAISLEKENETYDLLHMTLVRPIWLVFGKLFTSLGVMVFIAVALLPVAGVVFFLVGVTWSEFLLDYLLLATCALTCGCAAIACSAFFRRTVIALAASYMAMLIIIGLGFPFLMVFFRMFANYFKLYDLHRDLNSFYGICYDLLNLATTLMEDFSRLTPFYLLFGHSLNNMNIGVMKPEPGIISYAVCFFFLITFAFAFFWLAVWRTSQPPDLRAPKFIKPLDNTKLLDARRRTFPYYLLDPMKRKPMIGDHRNPMMIKEMRFGLLGELSRLVRIFYSLLGFNIIVFTSAFLYFGDYNLDEGIKSAMLLVMGVNLLILPALIANILTKEYEQGNIDMLRMTLITPREVIFGKVAAGLLTVLPLFFATLLASSFLLIISVFVWHETGLTWAIFQGLITLLLCMCFCVSLTVLVSANTRNTQTAIVGSYVFCVVALFGGFVIVFAVLELYTTWRTFVLDDRGYKMSDKIYYLWLNRGSALSPIVAYMGPFESYRWKWPPDQFRYLYWVCSVVIFSEISLLFAAITTFVFKRSKSWSQ